MKLVQRFQTRDGLLHETKEAAKCYAEKIYGIALSQTAHRLVSISKYTDMQDYLDRSLAEFAKLAELKADIEVDQD